MTDQSTMSTLKKQWVILKDDAATNEAKVKAYSVIDALQKANADDPEFKAVPLQETRYKIYETLERANSSPKPAAPEAKPKADYAPKAAPVSNELLKDFAFSISAQEQEKYRNEARRFFEAKVIAAQVASEPQFAKLGFDNVMSVGQAAAEIFE